MKKLQFGSLLVNKGLSTYEPYLLRVLSSLVIFPDGDNLLSKYIKLRDKVNAVSSTGIYVRVVDSYPRQPMKNVIYLIDENKEYSSYPEAALIRIVEKVPDTIEKGIVYMIDSSGLTEEGTLNGLNTNIDINLSVSHDHDNLKVLDSFDMKQVELLNAIKTDANQTVYDMKEDIEEIKEKVGVGTEPISNSTIDELYK